MHLSKETFNFVFIKIRNKIKEVIRKNKNIIVLPLRLQNQMFSFFTYISKIKNLKIKRKYKQDDPRTLKNMTVTSKKPPINISATSKLRQTMLLVVL